MPRMTKLSPDNAEWKQDLAWFEGRSPRRLIAEEEEPPSVKTPFADAHP
jgi:hypothetical protein